MELKNVLTLDGRVAVLGAGKFGTAIANLIAPHVGHLLLYTRSAEEADAYQQSRTIIDQVLADNIIVTSDLGGILRSCVILFPIVPAAAFRGLMQSIAPYLKREHILIHGTKGLSVSSSQAGERLTREQVATMSEVIKQETIVQRIACFAGPNLSAELAKKYPTATVIAGDCPEVLTIGKQLLTHSWFQVYSSNDLLGIEFAALLKNIFAIGAGLLRGIGYGENSYAFFLTLALGEMQTIIVHMGGHSNTLWGVAGLGDLVATCGSSLSRNYKMGYQLAKGEQLIKLLAGAKEVSEGVETVKTIYQLMGASAAPLTAIIYKILFEQFPIVQGVDALLQLPRKLKQPYPS